MLYPANNMIFKRILKDADYSVVDILCNFPLENFHNLLNH